MILSFKTKWYDIALHSLGELKWSKIKENVSSVEVFYEPATRVISVPPVRSEKQRVYHIPIDNSMMNGIMIYGR